jgi:hypothetical protein
VGLEWAWRESRVGQPRENLASRGVPIVYEGHTEAFHDGSTYGGMGSEKVEERKK